MEKKSFTNVLAGLIKFTCLSYFHSSKSSRNCLAIRLLLDNTADIDSLFVYTEIKQRLGNPLRFTYW